jgi:hypothetical protein
MKDEIWKDVKGYEGLYQISSYGIVKSLPREWYAHGVKHSHNGRIITAIINGGYKKVALTKNSITKSYSLHQLLAINFLYHRPNETNLVVDHIDNNRLNNSLDNLQLISQRENSSKDVKNATSKFTGVSWCKNKNKWQSCITINKKLKHLGYFDCELKGHLAYKKALKEIQYATL